jgi:predicted nucleotidyltransferase
MRFYTDLPKKYNSEVCELPSFDQKGNVSLRVINGLENTLYLYSKLGKKLAENKDNNSNNLKIKEVGIVGSCAKSNKINSDLDFLLIAPDIDEEIAKDLKIFLSYVLFCDRNKQEAIDVFIRPFDKYPSRPSKPITFQVKDLINKYNKSLS